MTDYREMLRNLAHSGGNSYIEAVNQKNQLIDDLYSHIGGELDISEIAFWIGIPADNDLDDKEFSELLTIYLQYNEFAEEREV